MPGKELNILLVAADSAANQALSREIARRIPAQILHVESVDDAIGACAARTFDITLAAESLPNANGADLLDHPLMIVPVVLFCERASADTLLSAFRAGVADVITGPMDYGYLAATIRDVVRRHRGVELANRRAARLRSLSKGLIRDRRELRRRVDLICTDIVSAYQLLARKVVAVAAQGDDDSMDLPELSTEFDD